MILESVRWKRDLARYARDLRHIQGMKRIRASSRARLEKCCMIGFYIVRKLTEAFQPIKIGSSSVPIFTYSPTGSAFDEWYWPEIGEYFDLQNPMRANIQLSRLCHEFIHSRIFTPCIDAKGLRGVFVVSEHKKRERLLRVDVDEVIEIFERLARSRKFYLRIGPVQKSVRLLEFKREPEIKMTHYLTAVILALLLPPLTLAQSADSILIGNAQIRSGMSRQAVLEALSSFDVRRIAVIDKTHIRYEPCEGETVTCNVAPLGETGKRVIASISFKSGRLDSVVKPLDQDFDEQQSVPFARAVYSAIAALVGDGKRYCTLDTGQTDGPKGYTKAAFIACGQRTIVIQLNQWDEHGGSVFLEERYQ